jgi:radical SAM superfamily enzyme YgiQ (UPF0313 family)
MRPPIAPIALDYLANSLEDHGHVVQLCDLAFETDWRNALEAAVEAQPPLAIGLTIRNIDDAYFASQDFILERTREIIRHLQELTTIPIVLGGVGFSAAPREILEFTGMNYGIVHDGEETFPRLLEYFRKGLDPGGLPGVAFRTGAGEIAYHTSGVCGGSIDIRPRRRFIDNPRYFAEGGQIGIETKRGCDQLCIYCADPPGKGHCLRLRSPESVVEEVQDLVDQGIDVFHLCDSEFNLPAGHAHAMCAALVARGLAGKVRWYTYATPLGFDDSLANAMAMAGCVGINFGIDHAEPDILRRLGRRHSQDDIRRTARACRQAGIVTFFDLLLGGPGETKESLIRAIEVMKEINPDRVGLSCGIRVYPHTALAHLVQRQGPLANNSNLHGTLENNENLLRPVFFIDAAVGKDIQKFVWSLVKDDTRFVIADPDQDARNYNYNDNTVLEDAIRSGERGAYWHILMKLPS